MAQEQVVSYLLGLWCLAQWQAHRRHLLNTQENSPQLTNPVNSSILPGWEEELVILSFSPLSCLSILRIGDVLTQPRNDKGRRSENEIPNGKENFMPGNWESHSTPLQLREAAATLEPVSSAWSGRTLRFCPATTLGPKRGLLLWAGANMRDGWAGHL